LLQTPKQQEASKPQVKRSENVIDHLFISRQTKSTCMISLVGDSYFFQDGHRSSEVETFKAMVDVLIGKKKITFK
jgi:hypothetical protein